MGLRFAIDKLPFFNRSAGSLAEPGKALLDWFMGGSNVAGVSVTEKTALSVAAVYKANRFISENMAALPGEIIKKPPGGNIREKLPLHRVSRLMNSPGIYGGFSFVETMQSYVNLHGNAVAIIRRDSANNNPTGFDIIPPDRVTPIIDKGNVYFSIRDKQGKPHVFFDYDVFHIPCVPIHPAAPGVWGLSPLQYHRTTLGFNIAVNEYGPKIFQGVQTNGYLSTEQELDDDQIGRIGSQWAQQTSGLENTGRTPVLEGGMKFIPINLKPEDMQFIDTRKINLVDIANIFGVPPYVVGDYSRANHSNIEQQSIDIVRYTLRIHAARWESAIQAKLISTKESNTHRYRFNLDEITRGDSQSRADLIETYMKWGIYNRDEIRELDDNNPIPNGEGEKTLIPMNYTTFENLPQNEPNDPNPPGNE